MEFASMNEERHLMEKTILVVGAGGGIGLALTQTLLARGISVIGTVLDEAERARVLQLAPGIQDVILLDLRNADVAFATLRPYVDSLAGPLDGVALCAAIGPTGPAETTPLQTFRDTFEVNVISQLAIFRATSDSLRSTRGRIMFVSSILGRIPMPFFAAYSSAKFAIEALADIVRREVHSFGIDVIIAEPGGVRTGMTSAQLESAKERLAALAEPERTLYGPLYAGHVKMAEAGLQGASDPSEITAVMADALTAAQPETRYLIGADALGMLDVYQPLDDRARDQFLLQIHGLTR